MTIETISREEHKRLRSICDKAAAYWAANATFNRDGSSSLSAELAAAPVYAACSNEMRGAVEQFEILNDPPERLGAYISKDESGALWVSVWTGRPLGRAYVSSSWNVDSYIGRRMYQFSATIAGREYTGRGFGEGMFVSLRETAASKRKRFASELSAELARYGFAGNPLSSADISRLHKAGFNVDSAYRIACDVAAGFPLAESMESEWARLSESSK